MPAGEAAPAGEAQAAAPTREAQEAEIDGTFEEGVHEGRHGSRRFRLFVPTGRERPTPLLVMLHGCTQDPEDFARGTRMNDRAGAEGWLVLYPEQPPEAHPQRCWNWYRPEHQTAAEGEPAILAEMIEAVAADREVDRRRIYLSGISAGGAMALVLAATRPDLFAAVAVHSGVPYGAARGQEEALAAMGGGGASVAVLVARLRGALDGREPPPLLLLQGTADPAVHPSNARRAALARWLAGADGETGQGAGGEAGPEAGAGEEPSLPDPDVQARGTADGGLEWSRRAWHHDGAPAVEWWEIEGLGHAWSGGDPAGSYTDSRGPDASAVVTGFFRRVSGDERGAEGGTFRPGEGP